MSEDRFEELMRDAAVSYRRPPEPPLDEMWTEIERATGDGRRAAGTTVTGRSTWRLARVLPIAATLVIGVGIGRFTAPRFATAPAAQSPVASRPSPDKKQELDRPYELAASRYFGQTAALLMALPSEAKAGRANEQFLARAGDLLSTTRLLLDSPAAQDQSMRNLLEDLELVLAQVVRLQDSHSKTELDFITQALEQREVISRLRTAAADLNLNADD